MSPIITPLSPTAVAAYQDLRRMMIDEAVAGMRGRPILRERAGRSYWYDQFRVGDAVKERYIGEDGPALRDRIAHHRDLADLAATRRSERARLVRVLRAEGMTSMDRQSGSLLRALSLAGVFRVGGVLVGTQAFRLYEGELGVRIAGADLAMTLDFDIAAFERLSLTIGDAVDAAPTDILKPFDFAPVPELDRDSVWRWKQSKSQALVEFLTPSFEEDEGIKPLKSLGVSARALRHLNYLIADPIQAVGLYREGVPVRVPRPERFAIHKLIVADRRRTGPDALKSRKDRAQARFLIHVLAEDRPEDLKEAYEDARAQGPRWRERMDASLARLPEEAAVLAGL
jgi:hypothetical protein